MDRKRVHAEQHLSYSLSDCLCRCVSYVVASPCLETVLLLYNWKRCLRFVQFLFRSSELFISESKYTVTNGSHETFLLFYTFMHKVVV